MEWTGRLGADDGVGGLKAASLPVEPTGGALPQTSCREGGGPQQAQRALLLEGDGPGGSACLGEDAVALAALLSSFLADLGLQQHLQVVPGPLLGQEVPGAPLNGTAQAVQGSCPRGAKRTCAAGHVARQGQLPGGGVVELTWRRQSCDAELKG